MQRLLVLTIPLITIVVALLGGLLSSSGMMWYDQELIQPVLTPPKWAFPVAWNIIFVLTTISAIIVYRKGQDSKRFLWFFKRENMGSDYWSIISFFIANAILNVLWSYLFFNQQLIGWAFIDMILLEVTNIALIVMIWPKSRIASLLLIPYTLWVGFATYLTWQILLLN